MNKHQKYIHRCLELAKKGLGSVAPNPMVGAVLLHDDKIIGEGWHQQYGNNHAEVNCIQAVAHSQKHLIPLSELYVSLEPCAHFGKTAPCVDLIIENKIQKVIIGCRDPFKEVNGKGIEKLKAAGITVELVSAELESDCKQLNRRFFIFNIQERPFIILKWAQTGNEKIAFANTISSKNSVVERLLISNDYSNRLVHKWRSEETAILVGSGTAAKDNPSLTTRLWPGKSPVRLLIDRELQVSSTLNLFDKKTKTIVFNCVKQQDDGALLYYKLENNANFLSEMLKALHALKIQSVIVEGGATLLQAFINAGLWDEARVITNKKLIISEGLNAPQLSHFQKISEEQYFNDSIIIYKNKNTNI